MPFSSTGSSLLLLSMHLVRSIRICRSLCVRLSLWSIPSLQCGNGQGRFILENAEGVPECDAELLLDECIFQPVLSVL